MPTLRRILLEAAIAMLASGSGGCGSDLPEHVALGSISGTVEYSGEAIHGVARPGLVLVALTSLDLETALPHSFQLIEDPQFTAEGLAFRLAYLEPFRYTLVGLLSDLDSDLPLMETAMAWGLALDIVVDGDRETAGVRLFMVDGQLPEIP